MKGPTTQKGPRSGDDDIVLTVEDLKGHTGEEVHGVTLRVRQGTLG